MCTVWRAYQDTSTRRTERHAVGGCSLGAAKDVRSSKARDDRKNQEDGACALNGEIEHHEYDREHGQEDGENSSVHACQYRVSRACMSGSRVWLRTPHRSCSSSWGQLSRHLAVDPGGGDLGVVGVPGFEPGTSSLSGMRSNQAELYARG